MTKVQIDTEEYRRLLSIYHTVTHFLEHDAQIDDKIDEFNIHDRLRKVTKLRLIDKVNSYEDFIEQEKLLEENATTTQI